MLSVLHTHTVFSKLISKTHQHSVLVSHTALLNPSPNRNMGNICNDHANEVTQNLSKVDTQHSCFKLSIPCDKVTSEQAILTALKSPARVPCSTSLLSTPSATVNNNPSSKHEKLSHLVSHFCI